MNADTMEKVREQAAMNALGPNTLTEYATGALRRAEELLNQGYPQDAAELARFAADILQSATQAKRTYKENPAVYPGGALMYPDLEEAP